MGPWVVIFIRSLSLNLATWGVHDFEDKGNLVKVAGSAAAGVWTPKDVLTPIRAKTRKAVQPQSGETLGVQCHVLGGGTGRM